MFVHLNVWLTFQGFGSFHGLRFHRYANALVPRSTAIPETIRQLPLLLCGRLQSIKELKKNIHDSNGNVGHFCVTAFAFNEKVNRLSVPLENYSRKSSCLFEWTQLSVCFVYAVRRISWLWIADDLRNIYTVNLWIALNNNYWTLTNKSNKRFQRGNKALQAHYLDFSAPKLDNLSLKTSLTDYKSSKLSILEVIVYNRWKVFISGNYLNNLQGWIFYWKSEIIFRMFQRKIVKPVIFAKRKAAYSSFCIKHAKCKWSFQKTVPLSLSPGSHFNRQFGARLDSNGPVGGFVKRQKQPLLRLPKSLPAHILREWEILRYSFS